ncbi:MAG: sulfatase [Reichenbachiella sp.]
MNNWIVFVLLVSLGSCSDKEQREEKVYASIPSVINVDLSFRPNIVWIVAEDLSPVIPSYGDSTIVTPHLDRLASQGVCYDNFYTPHPVCATARAALITGKYANNIGASHMRTGPWYAGVANQQTLDTYNSFDPNQPTAYEAIPNTEVRMFTEQMRTAGYYCSNNSKEDYQMIKTPTAWDESSSKAHWRNRNSDQPFFSVFNIMVTHESKIWSKSEDSLWVENNLDVPIPLYLPDSEVAKRDIRRMYSNVLEMDHQVGEILQQLEDDQLLDSTIVIWYTDHGGPLPRQKRLLLESGIKVPMIIRFPNEEYNGARDSRMISFVDMAATMLSLIGEVPTSDMDGSAFLGTYLRANEPQYVFGAADRFDEISDKVRSVTDGEFKYIKNYQLNQSSYMDVSYRKQMPIMQELLRLKDADELTDIQQLWFKSQKVEEEFYDLAQDPYEINNVAQDPNYQEKLKELREANNTWLAGVDDQGLQDEKQLIEEFNPGGIQPATAKPVVEVKDGLVNVTCATIGASIGYKIRPDDKSWKVYIGPFEIQVGEDVTVIAHRLGYQRSEEVSLPLLSPLSKVE